MLLHYKLDPFLYGVVGLTVVVWSLGVAMTGALCSIPSSHPAPFDEGAFASSDNLESDSIVFFVILLDGTASTCRDKLLRGETIC